MQKAYAKQPLDKHTLQKHPITSSQIPQLNLIFNGHAFKIIYKRI